MKNYVENRFFKIIYLEDEKLNKKNKPKIDG